MKIQKANSNGRLTGLGLLGDWRTAFLRVAESQIKWILASKHRHGKKPLVQIYFMFFSKECYCWLVPRQFSKTIVCFSLNIDCKHLKMSADNKKKKTEFKTKKRSLKQKKNGILNDRVMFVRRTTKGKWTESLNVGLCCYFLILT